MKLKAKLYKENLLLFAGILAALERIGNTAILYLTPDCVRLCVVLTSIDSPKVYSELHKDALFFEYRIESQSENCILLEVNLNLIGKAFASGKHAQWCQLKLVKRGLQPFLCVETQAQESMLANVLHDVPITIKQPADIVHYLPPEMVPPSVSLEMPRGRLMRTVVEKLGKHITLQAEQVGRLVFCATTTAVTIKTYYTGLTPRYDILDPVTDRHNTATVKLDTRKLSAVLNLQQIVWDHAIIFVAENEALVLHITLSPADLGTVTIYVPVVIDLDISR